METTIKQQEEKKQTSQDLRSDKYKIESKIEELLHQHDGEVTLEVNELLIQLTEINDSIVDKIKSLSWAYKKVNAEIASIRAKEKYWKQILDAEKKAREARENNLESIKKLAAMNLRSLDEESVRIDGKKVYLRKFCKVTITDEEKAFPHLERFNLASEERSLDGESYQEVMDRLNVIRQEIQTQDGEPVRLSPEANTAIGRAIDILSASHVNYKFAGGKDINAHGMEIHEIYLRESEQARERLVRINEQLDHTDIDLEQEEELGEERQQIIAYLDKLRSDHSIPGAEIEINKTVFGL